MATGNIREAFRSFLSWASQSADKNSTDDSSKICWIFNLPPEILQTITDHLTVHDIISLSQTCQTFYTLIKDDNFWVHRIRSQFSPSTANLYILDLFEKPETILTNDETRPSGFENIRVDGELDLAAINSVTHYNDEAIEKRHAKMYISTEDFLTHVEYLNYRKPKNTLKIPLMKLVYFYLIDRKRTAAVNMSVIHRNDVYLIEDRDKDSLTGRIIQLQSVCWLEITGRFDHDIMPGKYEAIWRMKCHAVHVHMWGETEFSIVPSHGKMLIRKISENDFHHYAVEHGKNWFTVNMGEIIVYERSTVLVGIRNWSNGNWKSGISWDCIELKVTP